MLSGAGAGAAARCFVPASRIIKVEAFGNGLINSSWVIHCKQWSAQKIFLQRMNRHVFSNPEQIIENIQQLHAHIKSLPAPKPNARVLRFPDLITTRDGSGFFIDDEGEYWRAFQFLEQTQTLETVQTTHQAREIGYVLGRFHSLLSDIDLDRLKTTLADFHVTPNYLHCFDLAYKQSQLAQQTDEFRQCLVYIERFRNDAHHLEQARQSNHLPTRLIHGDPKRDNILFDQNTEYAVSLIDLDTMQPGLIHYDIGDCLRSCCGTVVNPEQAFSSMTFNLDIFETILQSYLEHTRKIIRPIEYNWFYDAILLIPFELGLRFLTDYLNGNVYFKTTHPRQNLEKALQQFTLAADIEANKTAIQTTIQRLKQQLTDANQVAAKSHSDSH